MLEIITITETFVRYQGLYFGEFHDLKKIYLPFKHESDKTSSKRTYLFCCPRIV